MKKREARDQSNRESRLPKKNSYAYLITEIRQFAKSPRRFLKKISRRQFFLLLLAMVVGIFVGLASVFLKESIEYALSNLFHARGEVILDSLKNMPFYIILLIPALGGLVVGLIKQFLFSPSGKGGVEQVMESMAVKEGRINFKEVVEKFITSALTLGSGGSAGKEGPVVHIGGGIGSVIARYFRLPAEYVKALVGAGAAAGIAAAFNAPIAGTFFALEILIGDFSLNIFSMIMVASISATAASRHFLGEHPAFSPPSFVIENPVEILFYILLGILAGFICVLFTRSLIISRNIFNKIKIQRFLKPALGGLIIGLIALGIPNILGVGYGTIDHLLKFEKVPEHLLLFKLDPGYSPSLISWALLGSIALILLAKIIATSITLGSGGSGGTIVPALFLGATLGAFVGQLANVIFPGLHISVGAFALIGMGSIIAGTTQAPIMAILLFFETTRSYNIILPVATVSIVTSQLTKYLLKGSMYTLELKEMGIDLYEGMEKTVMSTFKVSDVMREDLLTIPHNMRLREIMEIFLHTRYTTAFVVNKKEELVGKLNLDDLRKHTLTPAIYNVLIASEIMDENLTCLKLDDSLSKSVEMMSEIQVNLIPVVKKEGSRSPVGYVSRRDVLNIYQKEILRKNISGIKIKSPVSKLEKLDEESHQAIDFKKEYLIKTISVPKELLGLSLVTANLRKKYGITVLAVKDTYNKEHFIPGPDYILKSDDKIVIAANKKDINKLPLKISD